MKNREKLLRDKSRELLEKKEVDFIIGYVWGRDKKRVCPAFIKSVEEVENLVWNPMCVNNLTLYYTRKYSDVRAMGRPAIVVKGCDARCINVLIQEGQLKREDVILLAMPCEGVAYRQELYKGELTIENASPKCAVCDVNNPPLYDYVVGEKVDGNTLKASKSIYDEIGKLDETSQKDKWDFWAGHFKRCIRCYACRQVCPLCYCERCIADKNSPQWIDTSRSLQSNFAWNMVRAFHLVGRCTFCGECDRACPVDIPLNLLNQKLSLTVKENFEYRAGYDGEGHPPLIVFSPDDKENFIK